MIRDSDGKAYDMTAQDELRGTALEILRRFSGFSGDLTPDLQLGSPGVGLDSIALVEFLLELEAATGREATTLLERPTLTVGEILEHIGANGR